MNSYAKRNYFLSLIKSVKGNKEAKTYLVDYYLNKLSVKFFDHFTMETIDSWNVKKQVLELQEIINTNQTQKNI